MRLQFSSLVLCVAALALPALALPAAAFGQPREILGEGD